MTGLGEETPMVPLEEIARRVVVDYLALSPDETYLVVGDTRTSPELPRALFEAALAVGAKPIHALISPLRVSGEEPPDAIAAAMAAADAVTCCSSRSLMHNNAKLRAERAGTRGQFNAPCRAEWWTQGAMTADFLEMRKTAERLAAKLRGAKDIRVSSPAGTDVVVPIGDREPKAWLTGVCRNPGEVSAFPGGEVSFPPIEGGTQGTMVFERVMTDLGPLDEPIAVEVVDGLAVSIEGGTRAHELRQLVDGVEGATNIGELGIGINDRARITDDITESKKRIGTAHMALGDSAGGYGGVVDCPLHLDGLMLDVTITIDGETIVDGGRLVL
jgi:leucyl aminopeptidase (aminopeptidase T)